jgi:hypothetical protein
VDTDSAACPPKTAPDTNALAYADDLNQHKPTFPTVTRQSQLQYFHRDVHTKLCTVTEMPRRAWAVRGSAVRQQVLYSFLLPCASVMLDWGPSTPGQRQICTPNSNRHALHDADQIQRLVQRSVMPVTTPWEWCSQPKRPESPRCCRHNDQSGMDCASAPAPWYTKTSTASACGITPHATRSAQLLISSSGRGLEGQGLA